MNILVINGSPKGENSNTMNLTRAFLEGAGWTNAEIIHVAKAGVKSCLGCYACWTKTPGMCVIDDGMGVILSKIIAADVIIWSFPLYYFSVPGELKTLIDRQLPLNLPFMEKGSESGSHPARYDLSQQRHVVISTCGFWTAERNYNAVTAMFDHYYGAGNYGTIFCGQGELFRIPELKNRTKLYLKIVRLAGAEFAAGGISAKLQAGLSEPLFPRTVFEKMADASWNITSNDGGQPDESLQFTRQMAALYRPDDVKRVLEIYYTDIEKNYQLLLTEQGAEVITDNFRQYTTRIETPYALWRAISRGEISGQEALFRHQYKVLGDFGIMLKWDELFGTTIPQKPTGEKSCRKSNMAVLLAPWIIIWALMAVNPTIGSVAGIIATASVPLLWLFFQPVVFEQISIPIVAGLSLAALFGAEMRMLVPVGYLMFGLMWVGGACCKTPLSAYYSAANYGGEHAFANPLFIKTNRILTAAWGVLYLIIPIWTYILMGTDLSAYTGLINSLFPALMGIFTLWFQKWYPAQWAGG